ncbi:MAG: glycosyltransferase [Spirochaetia bacterium]|nr:glycosyltransferase [Spirochaetia bacterium]
MQNRSVSVSKNQTNVSFKQSLINDFDQFMKTQKDRFPVEERLQVDLHCHDKNSDVPDEILGRLLEIPETWLETDELIGALKRHGCDTYTITNHNNARSCFELQDRGMDILTAAEFTCHVPDYNIWIHVLTYGFSAEEEIRLNKLRYNLYKFLVYTNEHNIPTIWAHPLYYYSVKGIPPISFFEKLSVIFERFEVVNGQRNTRQNLLMKEWVERLSPSRVNAFAKKYKLEITDYCRLNKKSISGGSDSHMGIFPGLSGTYLHVPNLKGKLARQSRSQLALEAIRDGKMAPYGTHNESERLMVAFLDYFCQIPLYMRDPGLIRIILHKGEPLEKLEALVLGNGFLELRRHKVTMSFLKTFHQCFKGQVPSKTKSWFIKSEYREIFQIAREIAVIRKETPEKLTPEYLNTSIMFSNEKLNKIFFSRLGKKLEKLLSDQKSEKFNFESFVRSLELPLEFGRYIGMEKKKSKEANMSLQQFLDGLPFPFLAASVIYGAAFAGTRVLHNSRPLLDEMAQKMRALEQPARALWLTDTFSDKNGVAHSLRVLHEEIKRRNLPIDILVCSDTIEPDDHLIVVRPVFEFTVPMYEQQPFRIPDLLQVHRIFDEGSYDRLVCSTEGSMGLISMALKNAFSVPAYFFLHTDWLTFAQINIESDIHMVNRFRRLLRVFYRQYDYLFVLNNDQQKWLSGKDIGIESSRIFKTAHWVDAKFIPKTFKPEEVFGTEKNEKILLFVGRVSKEKGVMDLPYIYEIVKKEISQVRLVVVGSGPAEFELKEKIPDLIHIPWIDHDKLPQIYSSADLLVLPSTFDTFGLVVLEALGCGLPVAAYDIMGPGEIIESGKSGYLAKNKKLLSEMVVKHFTNINKIKQMRKNALERSKQYHKDNILKELLKNLDLPEKK